MPHAVIRLGPVKLEQQKARLAEVIAKDVMDVLNYRESVSVAIETRINRVNGTYGRSK